MANPNILSLSVDQFITMVETEYSLPKEQRRPIFGIGKPGLGKTVGLRDLAKKLGIGFVDLRLTNYTEVDLKGIPVTDNDTNTAKWYPSNTLPNADIHGDKGILLLDEITGASRPVRLGVYQLIEKGELESYKMPDGWYIVACGNNEEDMVEVYNALSIPLKNRGFVYHITAESRSFKIWGRLHGIHPLVLAYVSWSEDSLHSMPTDPEDIARTPRSWETVSDSLKLCESGRLNVELMYNRMAGSIGVDETKRFITFTKFKDQIPEIERIMDGSSKPDISQPEILHITIQSGINRLVKYAEDDLQKQSKVTTETIQKFGYFCKWLFGLDNLDTKAMAVSDMKLCMKQETIVSIMMNKEFNNICPEFATFAMENKSLFTS